MRASATPPPAPSEATLHEAALAYLAQRAASVAQLTRALGRKIDTWARRAERAGISEEEITIHAGRARGAIERIVTRLSASGLLNDALYAKQRADRLARSGKSRRAIAFDLKMKGIAEGTAREAVPDDAATELASAVALARKKRIGPFAKALPDDREERRALEQKWLGAFARGGYSFGVAQKVMRLDREEAEALIQRGW